MWLARELLTYVNWQYSLGVLLFDYRLSSADVEACFREFDRDLDNRLSYDEFCVMMNTRKHSLELLLEHHKTRQFIFITSHVFQQVPPVKESFLGRDGHSYQFE